MLCCRGSVGSVNIEVAYIEALDVRADNAPISIGCLARMLGTASMAAGLNSQPRGQCCFDHNCFLLQRQMFTQTDIQAILNSSMLCCRGHVDIEVAYTEALEVRAGDAPISIGFLDTMNGTASLVSEGKGISVNGLDGTANVQSHGGPIQVCSRSFAHLYHLCASFTLLAKRSLSMDLTVLLAYSHMVVRLRFVLMGATRL